MTPSSLLLESYLELFDHMYTTLLEEQEWMEAHQSPREGAPAAELITLYQQLEEALESFAAFKAKRPLDSRSQDLIKQVQNKLMQLMLLSQDNEAAVLRMGLQRTQAHEALAPISTKQVSLIYKTV